MDNIREDYVYAAMKPKKRAAALRWGALAASLVLIFTLGFGVYQNTRPQEPEIVLPPDRLGKTQDSASIVIGYTLQEAWQTADAVAWVRIRNWLGEDFSTGSGIGKTFFEVEIIQAFKGDLTDQIVLMQIGSSAGTIKHYPLFTYGEEMVLFLKETVNYENCYGVLGEYSTILDIARDNDGNTFVLDSFYFLSETVQDLDIEEISDIKARNEVFTNLMKVDPLSDLSVLFPNRVVLEIGDFLDLLN